MWKVSKHILFCALFLSSSISVASAAKMSDQQCFLALGLGNLSAYGECACLLQLAGVGPAGQEAGCIDLIEWEPVEYPGPFPWPEPVNVDEVPEPPRNPLEGLAVEEHEFFLRR